MRRSIEPKSSTSSPTIAAQRPVRNPLTDLAGNVLLTEELKYRLKTPNDFALLYVDIDNFKAFNDTYGFARGDRVIKLVAEVLVEAVQRHGNGTDFIGHIGGDDFAVLTAPDIVDALCKSVIALFDQRVRALYDPEDLARGHLQGTDRQGVPRHFPIISLSIGVVTNRQRSFTDHEEISRVAAEMKQFAKQQPGSSYAIDVRSDLERQVQLERRGSRLPAVLLISQEGDLHSFLRAALKKEGYRTFEAPGILEAHALLAHEPDLALLVADARLGDPLWELTDSLRDAMTDVPIIVLSTRAQDEQIGLSHGARAFIQQPFQIQRFLACVAQFVRPGE
jgi:diguanylate cyclase (GGDEF)-like protein